MSDSDSSEAFVRKHLAHIYLQNCLPSQTWRYDWRRIADIVSCVPIGLAQYPDNIMRTELHRFLQYRYGTFGKYLSNEDVDNGRITDIAQQHRDERNWILLSFNEKNNIKLRQPMIEYFCNNASWVWGEFTPLASADVEVGVSPFNQLGGGLARCIHFHEMSEYNTAVTGYRFVLSPHGLGADCYRTWEVLFLGAYPVVVTSQLDLMYEDLPVLIVDNYTSITPALLDATYKAFREKTWNLEKLYNDYWENRIYAKRIELGGSRSRLQYNLV